MTITASSFYLVDRDRPAIVNACEREGWISEKKFNFMLEKGAKVIASTPRMVSVLYTNEYGVDVRGSCGGVQYILEADFFDPEELKKIMRTS